MKLIYPSLRTVEGEVSNSEERENVMPLLSNYYKLQRESIMKYQSRQFEITDREGNKVATLEEESSTSNLLKNVVKSEIATKSTNVCYLMRKLHAIMKGQQS